MRPWFFFKKKYASLRNASSELLWGITLTVFVCGRALFPLSDLLETIRVRFIPLRLIIRRDIIARREVGIDLGQKYFLSDSFKSRQKRGKCAWFISWSITLPSAQYCSKTKKVYNCVELSGRQLYLCHFVSQNEAFQITLQTYLSEQLTSTSTENIHVKNDANTQQERDRGHFNKGYLLKQSSISHRKQ